MDKSCEHRFVYGGVKYEVQEWKLPGTGAQPIYYFDWFFCEKCTHSRFERLEGETNTYQKLEHGASPKQLRDVRKNWTKE